MLAFINPVNIYPPCGQVIVPNNHQDLVQLLGELSRLHPGVASFGFSNRFHYRNWKYEDNNIYNFTPITSSFLSLGQLTYYIMKTTFAGVEMFLELNIFIN